jgi:hypothetical protein
MADTGGADILVCLARRYSATRVLLARQESAPAYRVRWQAGMPAPPNSICPQSCYDCSDPPGFQIAHVA